MKYSSDVQIYTLLACYSMVFHATPTRKGQRLVVRFGAGAHLGPMRQDFFKLPPDCGMWQVMRA